MKYEIFIVIIILLTGSISFSQYSDEELKVIKENITFSTDDLKKPLWEISDLDLISEILQNLINNRELKVKDENGKCQVINNSKQITQLWEEVHSGQFSIICRRRQYDKQVEHMEFLVNGSPKYCDINDWLVIKAAITAPTYQTVINRNYDLTDFTRQDYINSVDTSYAVLNIVHSEFVLSSLGLSAKGKGILSAYYQLGNDNINLPSWYKGSINIGLKYKFFPYYGRRDFNYDRFSVSLGWDGPIDFSIQKNYIPGFMENMFRDRLLKSTSDNLFIGFSFSPRQNDPIPFKWLATDEMSEEFIQLNAEASLPIFESDKGLSQGNNTNFYSVRSYLSLRGSICNLWDFFNVGASFSYFQLNNYSTVTTTNELSILGSKKHYLVSIEPAISREDPPFHYYISPQINFDLSDGQKFFVLKSHLMFFGSFGIEFEYFESLNKKNTVPWQYKNYIVLSPIFRINY